MAESSLTLTLHDLEAEVGRYAGYGYGENFGDTEWTTEQQREIDSSVRSGVRSVYWTQEMEGVPARYEWSWLRPTTTLSAVSGAEFTPLPADFNGMLADVIPISSDGEASWAVPVVGYGELYKHRRASPDTTGRPIMAYIEAVKGTHHHHSSRYRLQFYPIPDATYTLQLHYEVAPNALDQAFPYIYGGPALSECFKAAVRAAYERDFDNIAGGPEYMNFVTQLRAAIAGDRKFKPLTLGPNIDRSDYRRGGRGDQHGEWDTTLVINGVEY